MRTLVRWLVVTLGVAALVRWLRGRGEASWVEAQDEALDDPAEELRRKLAESRGDAADAEPAPDTPAATVDERRADVHAQGRATLSEMTPPDEG